MIHEAMSAVRAFMKKMKLSERADLSKLIEDRELSELGVELMKISNGLMERYELAKDLRYFRGHLVLSEVAEMFIAMGELSTIGVLDALADLEYVSKGTAITFALPLTEAFMEVHRSNMTKSGDAAVRVLHRDKGPDYEKPDLVQVYMKHVRQYNPHVTNNGTTPCELCGWTVEEIEDKLRKYGRSHCSGRDGSKVTHERSTS